MFLNFFSTVRFARTFHPHPHPVCTRLCMSAIHNCPPQPNHHLRDYHTNCYAHIGLFTTDRDEQMSSLSRTGSGYSPSFFFKPIKYGVMGNTLASNTNTVNNTTIKHQAVASLGNGKLANLPLFSLFSTPFWLLLLLDRKFNAFSLHTHLLHTQIYMYGLCCICVCDI